MPEYHVQERCKNLGIFTEVELDRGFSVIVFGHLQRPSLLNTGFVTIFDGFYCGLGEVFNSIHFYEGFWSLFEVFSKFSPLFVPTFNQTS
jgi:hypothetical protein